MGLGQMRTGAGRGGGLGVGPDGSMGQMGLWGGQMGAGSRWGVLGAYRSESQMGVEPDGGDDRWELD